MKNTRKSAQGPPAGSLWAHETRMLSILCFVHFSITQKKKDEYDAVVSIFC